MSKPSSNESDYAITVYLVNSYYNHFFKSLCFGVLRFAFKILAIQTLEKKKFVTDSLVAYSLNLNLSNFYLDTPHFCSISCIYEDQLEISSSKVIVE